LRNSIFGLKVTSELATKSSKTVNSMYSLEELRVDG
jgi:hypothetical protein